MSKQSAYSLGEQELAPVLPSPTGTSHTLTVTVTSDTTMKISDPSLHIKDGDKVIWDFKDQGGGKLDLKGRTLTVSFDNQKLLSKPGKSNSDPAEITVDILEDTTGPGGPYPATYTVQWGTAILTTSHLTDSTSPQLVIDNMGKPPMMPKEDPDCEDERKKGEKHRPWPRRHTV
jgi:hypothetical protein